MRLLIIGPSLDTLGGQSIQAARLIERLRYEPSLSVDFLPINPRLPGFLNQLQKIKYVRTVVTSIAYIASLLLRVYKYDVLHVFSASYFSFVLAPTPAILIGKLYRRRVLLNYHSGEADDHLSRWRSAVSTIRLVDAIVVPSDYLVRVFKDFGLNSEAIYNLIDTSKWKFRDRVPLRPVFLSNRNLETLYGVDRVLRAFALIQKRIPEATLAIVGDGSQRRALESLAAELGLTNTIFKGQIQPDLMPDAYDAADIYLNGSEIDNQPLSLLESFACGLPIVTTDAGGIPYTVSDMHTGMVVSRGDYEGLADRVFRLLNEPELARKMIDEGRRECLKYSWEAVRGSWLKIYWTLGDFAHNAESLSPSTASESNVVTR
ncbi:MAG TPA: glycosyltransferase family 4 protein [Pyrinomonadaceae bacterium]|nr:glycosyltransferase family 4 protein [Pyrinomonadaceae bacterium]